MVESFRESFHAHFVYIPAPTHNIYSSTCKITQTPAKLAHKTHSRHAHSTSPRRSSTPHTKHIAHRCCRISLQRGAAAIDRAIVAHVKQLLRRRLHEIGLFGAVLGARLQDLEARVQRSNVIDGRVIVGIRLEEAAVEVALRERKTRREGRRWVRMWAAAGTNRRGAGWREERVWSVVSPSISPWCALRGGEQCGTRARWDRRGRCSGRPWRRW